MNSKLTRVEVIDDRGRILSTGIIDGIVLSYQDDGRTLKIFVPGKAWLPQNETHYKGEGNV